MEVDAERWAELPHSHLGSSERAPQAEERGTCEVRECEVLRKQPRRAQHSWEEGRQKGDLEEERGSSNGLLRTGGEEPPGGRLFSKHKWGVLLRWRLLEQRLVFFTWCSFLVKA